MNKCLSLILTLLQYALLTGLLISCLYTILGFQVRPKIKVCPTIVNKEMGQHIRVEGSSCIITTTIDDIQLGPETFRLHPYTIITAASAKDLCALENLLYNLYDYRAHMVHFPRIVVYNLGVNETSQQSTLQQLKANGLMDELIPFDYERYPSYLDDLKPVMLKEQAKNGGMLVWMDASNLVSLQFLYRLPSHILKSGGFWAPRSFHLASSANCNEAMFGLDTATQADVILDPWYQCSLDQTCQYGLNTFLTGHHHTCQWSARHFKVHTHRAIACRAMLMQRDAQKLLYHPSVVDHPPWTPSDTFDLINHPHWRSPQPKSIPPVSFLHLQQEDSNEEDLN